MHRESPYHRRRGLAGASAVAGIRQQDATGPILLISAEHDPPYDRPNTFVPI